MEQKLFEAISQEKISLQKLLEERTEAFETEQAQIIKRIEELTATLKNVFGKTIDVITPHSTNEEVTSVKVNKTNDLKVLSIYLESWLKVRSTPATLREVILFVEGKGFNPTNNPTVLMRNIMNHTGKIYRVRTGMYAFEEDINNVFDLHPIYINKQNKGLRQIDSHQLTLNLYCNTHKTI